MCVPLLGRGAFAATPAEPSCASDSFAVVPRRAAASLVLAVAAVLAAAPGASAHSEDSLAPAGAPPHWLPPAPWVYNHWLPFDERRLYRLLRVDRGDVWQQLRDDRHTLAELAARRGRPDTERLAAQLVAPWERRIDGARLRTLQHRALRTLTQGHLSQHL